MEQPDEIQTLPDALAQAARRWPERGLHFFDKDGVRGFISYPQLLSGAWRVARFLRAQNLPADARVLVSLPDGPEFAQVFFGVMSARLQPLPVMPPRGEAGLNPYLASLKELAERVKARALITPPQDISLLQERAELSRGFEWVWPAHQLLAVAPRDDEPPSHERSPSPGDVAWLQPTGGTTGAPKIAALTHGAVLANLDALGARLEIQEQDKLASWLSLSQSAGLVGGLLACVRWGLPLYHLDAERFLKAPHEWLWAFPNHRCTISLAPDSGYHDCARRARQSALEHLDLSCWRVALCVSEPIQPEHLRAFSQRFAPYGFSPSHFTPLYNLTEASLAAAASPPARGLVIDRVARVALEGEGVAAASEAEDAREVISLGPPLPGVEVCARDASGLLPERRVGELCLRGQSLMRGYADEADAEPDPARWIPTGDLGYVAQGEVYLTGRRTDLIHLEDRAVYPDELEALLAQIEGVRHGLVAVFGVPRSAAARNRHASIRAVAAQAQEDRPLSASDAHEQDATSGPELLIVACEVTEGFAPDQVRGRVFALLEEHAAPRPHDVRILSPGSIPKTTSGKVRRFLCREHYLDEALDRRERQERWQRVTQVTEDIRTYFADINRRLRSWLDR
jgi:acyl-CoA synthetase (AMP-forming)/AMP-acid ligase II